MSYKPLYIYIHICMYAYIYVYIHTHYTHKQDLLRVIWSPWGKLAQNPKIAAGSSPSRRQVLGTNRSAANYANSWRTKQQNWLNTNAYVYIYIHMNIKMCMCTYTPLHLRVCMYVCMHACMHACMFVCM